LRVYHLGMNTARPMIGLGVIIHDGNGSILLARRPTTKAVGAGTWQLPGGHLEMYEDLADAALREVSEECGPNIKIERPVLFDLTNNPWPKAEKHYVTLSLQAHERRS
jgi:8-oxo-dGTP diphosphatase